MVNVKLLLICLLICNILLVLFISRLYVTLCKMNSVTCLLSIIYSSISKHVLLDPKHALATEVDSTPALPLPNFWDTQLMSSCPHGMA